MVYINQIEHMQKHSINKILSDFGLLKLKEKIKNINNLEKSEDPNRFWKSDQYSSDIPLFI